MSETVSDTLAKPDLHKQWIRNYRTGDVNAFTAGVLTRVLEGLDLPENAKMLDAGCGSGTNSVWLAQRGFDVTGVDFSDFALEKARERAAADGLEDSIQFHREDLTSMSLPDAGFDAVFCIGVLMHIPDVDAALSELARTVRPGGYLVIAEANAHAVETYALRFYWRLFRPNVRVERRPCGLEVWSRTDAGPLLSRKFSMRWLTNALRGDGLERTKTITSEMTELYIYLGNQRARNLVHRLNRLWFAMRGPPAVAAGNVLVFRKR